MKKEKTHVVSRAYAHKLLALLRRDSCVEEAGDYEVLESIAVDFEDGVVIEIDILNGEKEEDGAPFLNVNWYQHHRSLYAFDTDPEGELFGTYDFLLEEGEEEEVRYLLHLVMDA